MSINKYMSKKDYFKVFDAFAAGKTNEEIASSISRSPMTIRRARNYLAAAYEGRLSELRIGKHSASLVGYVSEYALTHPLPVSDTETPSCEELPSSALPVQNEASVRPFFACRFCAKENTSDCLLCQPTNFTACTRFDLIRKLSVEDLALYFEDDLSGSVPCDWLAWLTEAVR